MSSLVTELLYSAGKMKKDDIPSKVEELRKRIEDIKIEVQQGLKSQYIDFAPQYLKLEKFSHKLNNASQESIVLIDQIEKEVKPQMSGITSEFRDMLENLNKIKALKCAVSNLVDIHSSLEDARGSLLNKNYVKGAQSLLAVQGAFKSINEEENRAAEIYFALKTDMYVTKEKIIFQLDELWKQRVCFKEQNNVDNFILTSTLSVDSNSSTHFSDLLLSMDLLGHLKTVIRKLGINLMKSIFEPIILYTTKVEASNSLESQTFSVLVISEQLPSPFDVLVSLTNAFTFLSDSFPSMPETSWEDPEGDKMLPMLRMLGSTMSKDFCMLLIEKCIKSAVPNHSNQLEVFQLIVDKIVDMHNTLLELGFFTSNENLLMEFIQNVDTLPANRMAQDYLSHARSMMQEGLHHVITVGIEISPSSNKESGDLKDMTRTKSSLSTTSFSFPRCQISSFMKELVMLLHKILKEAQHIASTYSVRLYYTVRNICELFCAVVPVYYKEEIATIPQQSAIHHNNCLYLAHCLLTIGTQYELPLPPSLPMTFVDLIPEIRKIGTEAFLAQMRCQRQLLLQALKDSAAFQNLDCDEKVFPKSEKAVHQCLCQLELLKKVWSDILPTEVYLKAIGTLLNTCLEELILHVTSMEDIAASSASQLHSVFTIILKQAPILFTIKSIDKANSIHLYVRKWFRFEELLLILGMSLREIVNRWSSGKGPLASYFTADEVKHLIRALFQNTERRAAALARIQ